jgi:hypothetical protein
MSAPPATRALIRQSRFLLRRQNFRQASTTAETAAKAKDTAGEVASKGKDTASVVTSKASEGLSRVTSSAGSVVSGAASSAANALNSVGGRTGRAIAFVRDCKSYYFLQRRLQCVERWQALTSFAAVIPPTIYYSRVGLELAKIVFKGQKMAPP